jgi:hypothetical protein
MKLSKEKYRAALREAEAAKLAAWEANDKEAWLEADQQITELGRQDRQELPAPRAKFSSLTGWSG